MFPVDPPEEVLGVQGSQEFLTAHKALVEAILQALLLTLPDNYVSQVRGPSYTLQLQAMAEILARVQLDLQAVFEDSRFDLTRPEFLFQTLGVLVFPDGEFYGVPQIEGARAYRTFLAGMIPLLIQGATKANIERGLALLTDADVEILEKGLSAKGKNSPWNTIEGLHSFEVNVSRLVGFVDADNQDPDAPINPPEVEEEFGAMDSAPLYGFPSEDPFTLQRNVDLVLRALKPAHTLYEYRHVFFERFRGLLDGEESFNLREYHYEDFRKYCQGRLNLTSSAGETLTLRNIFRDVTRDFSTVPAGSSLTITSGPNSIHSGGLEQTVASEDRRSVGRYTVIGIEILLNPSAVGQEVAYTTSPTGLSGSGVLSAEGFFTDDDQDFGSIVEGEVLTLLSGGSAGSYRIAALSGVYGGLPEQVTPPAGFAYTRVKLAPSLLILDRRMRTAASGQSYAISLDLKGVREDRSVQGEDVSEQFWL